LAEITLQNAGYRLRSTNSAVYGVVWSRHIHLQPTAELELTFANCSWARIDPVDRGTRCVMADGFRIVLDKDGMLHRLVDAVRSQSIPPGHGKGRAGINRGSAPRGVTVRRESP
jgi:hypothetical protein